MIFLSKAGDGRVVRRCWVNFQCRGVLLIWIIVGQGPIALAVGADGGCLDFFSLIYHFSFLSPSLWETVRYRLKYCLKGPLSPKQPTNQLTKAWEDAYQMLRSQESQAISAEAIITLVIRSSQTEDLHCRRIWPRSAQLS